MYELNKLDLKFEMKLDKLMSVGFLTIINNNVCLLIDNKEPMIARISAVIIYKKVLCSSRFQIFQIFY